MRPVDIAISYDGFERLFTARREAYSRCQDIGVFDVRRFRCVSSWTVIETLFYDTMEEHPVVRVSGPGAREAMMEHPISKFDELT
jgi:hypothetical protein